MCDGKLYTDAGFDTFEAYCRVRWEFSKSRASQLVSAANVADRVYNCKPKLPAPTNEAQARELAKLPEAEASIIAREAECRGGELLKGMGLGKAGLKGTQRKPGPGRGRKTVGEKEPAVSPLASLGLTPTESKRMQAAKTWKNIKRLRTFDRRTLPC